MEYQHSTLSNRPSSFDLDLPIDCDDEYWPVGEETDGFRQPPGKPSKLTVFIMMIKLFHLQADVVREIVSELPRRTAS